MEAYLHPALSAPDQRVANNGLALSHYAANGRLLGGGRGVSTSEIADGTSNTLMAGEVRESLVPWSHPMNWRDPAKGINQSPDGFGSPSTGGAHFLFADGSVRFLSEAIDPSVLKALATPAGGETVEEY